MRLPVLSSLSSPRSSSTSKARQIRKRSLGQGSEGQLQLHSAPEKGGTTWPGTLSPQEANTDNNNNSPQVQQQQHDNDYRLQQTFENVAKSSKAAVPFLLPSISSSLQVALPTTTLRYPPQFPSGEPEPTIPPPDWEDEDPFWSILLILAAVFIIMIIGVIRYCGQKTSWLTGASSSSSSNGRHSHGGGGGGGGRDGGRGGRSRGGYGPHHVPDWEVDPEATETRLAALPDTERQAYEAARAFQIVHPPNSIPTDISLSQYLSIQEKGVSAWEFEASYDQHLFVHDRTEISFFEQTACVQTNLPLPKQQEVYYWEVKMFEKSPNTTISVGVSTKPYPTTRLPGWNRHSVGYFSHNGQKYCNSLWSGYPYGPIYFEGDVVGCGYRPRNGTIFFTRNGKRIEDAYTGFGRMNLFPTVGTTGPCVLHVNFGQSGFVFVEANVKKWGLAPASGSLVPPPAYGSELGSILLEAAGSANNLQAPTSSSQRPIFQSSSSRMRVQSAGALRREDSFQGARGDGATVQDRSSSPVQISLSTMSAPPPNYSSLDRYGHPRHRDDDASSVASSESNESATLLLGDAQPDPSSGHSQDGEGSCN